MNEDEERAEVMKVLASFDANRIADLEQLLAICGNDPHRLDLLKLTVTSMRASMTTMIEEIDRRLGSTGTPPAND